MDREDRENLIEYLRQNAIAIADLARKGNECARLLIDYYDILFCCSDDKIWENLKQQIDKYKKMVGDE